MDTNGMRRIGRSCVEGGSYPPIRRQYNDRLDHPHIRPVCRGRRPACWDPLKLRQDILTRSIPPLPAQTREFTLKPLQTPLLRSHFPTSLSPPPFSSGHFHVSFLTNMNPTLLNTAPEARLSICAVYPYHTISITPPSLMSKGDTRAEEAWELARGRGHTAKTTSIPNQSTHPSPARSMADPIPRRPRHEVISHLQLLHLRFSSISQPLL